MATRQATPRQLAYLDELKMRLQELRDRQASFMEQTAKILSRMSSSNMVSESDDENSLKKGVNGTPLKGVNGGTSKGSKGTLNIKQLIQRFEDLRKNSQEFDDLPDVPEELLNVDVRRILNGYEKLIEDGSVLQQSWYLLKKSTESCARFASTNGMKLEEEITPFQENSGVVEVSYVVPERSPEVVRIPSVRKTTSKTSLKTTSKTALKTESKTNSKAASKTSSKSSSKIAPKPPIKTSSLHSNVATSAEIVDKKSEDFEPKDVKLKGNSHDYGHARWGAFMQLIVRLLRPFHGCSKNKKKRTRNHSSNGNVWYLPQMKTIK
ncbi:uncharacterized protein LOC108090065 isoform X2 [Drosophila ficusphila]|uniref:uncharacterized protein LOC108090065 isoform X2 n=1 Tax=Drosophila ficusphila TaxID=30025 RepID=UPI0007E7D385|nr:uncharacterized protein LOC108090065 isoform X2 [Drosophila ficusphila]